MIEIRPNCESCDKDLPANSKDAFICTFECTFCRSCVKEKFDFNCPNCGDKLVVRPIRSEKNLKNYSASTKRVVATWVKKSKKQFSWKNDTNQCWVIGIKK